MAASGFVPFGDDTLVAVRRPWACWLVIRPFSGLTRRSWLRAAKRRAESG